MKRILTLAASFALVLLLGTQCGKYDDSALWKEVNDLKAQVSNLQKSVDALNAYKTILDNSKAIKDVKENGDGTFTITFADGTPSVTINAGRGAEGAAGQDGITPEFKIEDGKWYASYDEGATWELVGSASDDDEFFQNVYLDGDFLVLVLLDGTEVRINLKGGSGSGDEPGDESVTQDDYLGQWSNAQGDIIEFYVGGGLLNVWAPASNYNDAGIQLTFDETDGSIAYIATYGGWACTGGSADGGYIYYYWYAYDASYNYATINNGDKILIGNLSKDKQSLTFTTGLDGYTGVRIYDESIGWGTHPGNWLGTYTKVAN